MLEIRVRSKVSAEEMEAKVGRLLLPDDVNVMLIGPTRVLKPDGQPLCVYLPRAIPEDVAESSYGVLHSLKNSYTSNRGMASGSKKIHAGGGDPSRRNYAVEVDSAIVGSYREETGPKHGICRLTAWTGRENEHWRELWPLFRFIGEEFARYVPDRFIAQQQQASLTEPEWLVPGTPFSTITINNTWATAVHKDKGDLEAGFSNLAVLRRGDYRGGCIVFPEYRVGVDMQDRDLLLMDAHEWHGNTPFDPEPARKNGKLVEDPGFERISIVCYYRTSMVKCGSAADEAERTRVYAENRNAALVGD